MKRWMLVLACLGAFAVAAAQAQPIKPGRYVRSGGGAVMDVGPTNADQTSNFDIDVIGANAHLCSVDGKIKAAKSTTDTGCQLDFGYRDGVVSVKPQEGTSQQCQTHCGMRAWFAGDYALEPMLCAQVKAVKKQFTQDYAAKNYLKAQKVLSSFVKTCDKFAGWMVLVPMRNDLAITQFHLGDKAACLNTLEPLRSAFIDVVLDDVMGAEPAFREDGVKLAKTSQFNWKKCGGTVTVPPAR